MGSHDRGCLGRVSHLLVLPPRGSRLWVWGSVVLGKERMMIKRWLGTLMLLGLLILPAGCGASVRDLVIRDAVMTANTSVLGIETAQDISVTLYREEQLRCLEQGVAAGDTREMAVAKIKAIRDNWKTTWEVFAKARLAHSTLASLISAGAEASDGDIAKAMGDLLQALRDIQGLLAGARQRAGG